MNYLILEYNSVFVAKVDPKVIAAKIKNIPLQYPMYNVGYMKSNGYMNYCQQVLNLLTDDFVEGFRKIEEYKQKLHEQLRTCGSDYFAAYLEASNILNQLQLCLAVAEITPFDRIPQCNPFLSYTRDEIISGLCKATKNPILELIGHAFTLGLKANDWRNIDDVLTFYNKIVITIGEKPLYENECKLLEWAKAQRGYTYFASVQTACGGIKDVVHIIDKATAISDIEKCGNRKLP